MTYTDFDNRFKANVLYNKYKKGRMYSKDCTGYGYFHTIVGHSIDTDTKESGLIYPYPCPASTSFNCHKVNTTICLAEVRLFKLFVNLYAKVFYKRILNK